MRIINTESLARRAIVDDELGAVCYPHVIHASRSAQEVGGEVEHGGGVSLLPET